ncbi:decaprenyl-diphosphate synthase subunit 1 isoform X2 [Eurytemora carolleeae]|uniref:decaprenyl-diphosphate synthase subunit 1 isoform X2 n=1 Tax=Eurytemora carolleeae TaxID=1294199 RepID=UPI000C75B88A|nr:decaprenyl-diphosphate synthase subunit 1 isoform X2 [Eurytemora carolleeae]|eukprot:XP_023332728.1 decaprenyl-diphosphate synthase subunit 1-like isoform X2 [Eurytemora affinis]
MLSLGRGLSCILRTGSFPPSLPVRMVRCGGLILQSSQCKKITSNRRLMSVSSPYSHTNTDSSSSSDPFILLHSDLSSVMQEIHAELLRDLTSESELGEMSLYYFDGKGKSLRPLISLCIGHAYNLHTNRSDQEALSNQRKVALISEMIHTASLIHDDILDHAESRRGKESINLKWNIKKSTLAGDYVLGVGSKLLSSIQNPDVVQILSQVLADLVKGEFMQLQTKEEKGERFTDYLNKSFNKTASLMAYSCKANVVLSGGNKDDIENSFQYGRNIGIAFQLVDDLLDFVSSADMLGKPAAADLQLGLATAPVLFAARRFPELELLINRRFNQTGDVEKAFSLVLKSTGLDETKSLARTHCNKAVLALRDLKDSEYKAGLIHLCDKVLNRIK